MFKRCIKFKKVKAISHIKGLFTEQNTIKLDNRVVTNLNVIVLNNLIWKHVRDVKLVCEFVVNNRMVLYNFFNATVFFLLLKFKRIQLVIYKIAWSILNQINVIKYDLRYLNY